VGHDGRQAYTQLRPYLLLLLLALIWGVHWSVVKVGLHYIPPFTYGALRAGVALAAVGVVLAWRGRLRLPDRRDLPVVISVGIGQMAAGIILMNLALQDVEAGRSSILVYTMPLWVAVISLPRMVAGGLGRAFRQLGGLLLGLVGIALLVNPGSIDWSSSGELIGSAELLVSAVLWAVATMHIRSHTWHGSPALLEPWQLLVALIPISVMAITLDGGRTIDFGPVSVAAIIFSGLLATAVAFWLSQSISRALSPLATTMGFLGVPVVGLASAWLLLGEPLSPLDAVGAVVTFAGILVVSLSTPGDEISEESLEQTVGGRGPAEV
jgi:drug/metabolite transporter (DMT)-like permease